MKANQQADVYKQELNRELDRIAAYWLQYTPDDVNGGIVGKVQHDNHIIINAPKGSVLHSRVLWFFSAAYNFSANPHYMAMADRAYIYITTHFIDKTYGGVYWTVDHNGQPLDTKKQVYANAFVIYGLSEYYKASGNLEAKNTAVSLYKLLVEKSYDGQYSGYMEAFTREWEAVSDLRLSSKDANEKKTMNTHLHVLEAYANLYRIWPDKELHNQIIILLYNFIEHFIDPVTGHMGLFFDEKWNKRSETVSYGHDIEAAWLLLEAAEVIKDNKLISKFKGLAVLMADATLDGLDKDYGLWYEYEPRHKNLIKEKHWWVQAEAMVGYYNAYQITGEDKYATISARVWDYVKEHIMDSEKGEWVWGIDADGKVMSAEDKVGIWKCPYHNGRACIEIINRIKHPVKV